METINRNGKRALFLLSSVLAATLSAQTTETKTEQPADDQVIELSPFSVQGEKENGYKASNSISGTRSMTPIKDIALNIQVFTKDLSDDLVVADQTALERYNAALSNGGADVQSDNNIQQAYNAFLFRGFIQNWGLRDGIREYDPIDAQGLARVEVVKGPAAALYGLSYAGGVMNNITKTVDITKNFGQLRFTASDEGGFRSTIDANYVGKMGSEGKFGVRYNGAYASTQDKREHSEGKTRFSQINLEARPFKGTTVDFLYETSWRQKPNGLGYYTRAGGDTADTAKAATETGIGVVIPLQADHPDIPWTWNWANQTNNRSLETHLYRGTVTQSIGENFSISGYVQANRHQNIDSNGWDDNGNSQNAAGWDVAGWSQHSAPATGWLNHGTANEVIQKAYHWRDWSNAVHAMGVNAVYKFEVASIKNTVTAGGADWGERFESNKWLTPASDNATVFVMPVAAGIDTTAPMGGAPTDYIHNTTEGSKEHNQNAYYYLNYQVSAIDNRLKLNAAVNHTKINNIAWGSVSADQHSPRVDVSKNSPMIGGMFDITKEVSVFAVHSTSLFPTTDKDDFGNAMPPEVGKANEVGVKVEILNGKISGTISYYKVTKIGGGVNDPLANNRNKVLWDTLTATERTARGWSATDRDSITQGDGITGARGNLVPAELESKGYEADVVFQPTKALQMVLSYAHNSEESTKGSTKGSVVGGHIDNQASLLTKYTFTEGAVKGLSVGLGLQYAGKALQDYQTDGSGNSVIRYNPSTKYAEIFASYKYKAFGFDQVVQFNAKNLTKQDDYIGWKPSGAGVVATERYSVPTYARFSVTWGVDF
jgi:iron complex outermembrane receptor protein